MARIDFTRGVPIISLICSRQGCCAVQGMVFRVLSLPHYFASLTECVFELEAFKRVRLKAAGSMKLV